MAPMEITYRTAIAYILKFDRTVSITKHDLRQCDTLKSIKRNTLEEDLVKLLHRNVMVYIALLGVANCRIREGLSKEQIFEDIRQSIPSGTH